MKNREIIITDCDHENTFIEKGILDTKKKHL